MQAQLWVAPFEQVARVERIMARAPSAVEKGATSSQSLLSWAQSKPQALAAGQSGQDHPVCLAFGQPCGVEEDAFRTRCSCTALRLQLLEACGRGSGAAGQRGEAQGRLWMSPASYAREMLCLSKEARQLFSLAAAANIRKEKGQWLALWAVWAVA